MTLTLTHGGVACPNKVLFTSAFNTVQYCRCRDVNGFTQYLKQGYLVVSLIHNLV